MPQPRDRFSGGRIRGTQGAARNKGKIGLCYSVELWCQLRCARWPGAERIDLGGEVTVGANRVDELRGAGDFSEEIRVRGLRCGVGRACGRPWSRDGAQRLGKSEELAPRFVYRGRVGAVGLVYLGYIAIVEDAGDWFR